jgi:hypothetical protein
MFYPEIQSTKMSLDFIEFTEFVEELGQCSSIVIYVRHKPTLDILLQHIPKHIPVEVSTGEYKVDVATDSIYIVALKHRQPQPGQDVNVKPEDLLVAKLAILILVYS